MPTKLIPATVLPALLLLSGCAGTPSGPQPGFQSLTGNWNVRLHPLDNLVGPIGAVAGSLQSSGTAVTGIFHVFGATACGQLDTDLSVTGTIDVSGALKLTFPLAGGTATLTETLGSDLQTQALGSLVVTGGACAGGGGSIGMQQIAPLTGTYQGTLTTRNPGPSNLSTNVSAVLTQSTTPDADGLFAVTGTVTATGGCTTTLPILTEAMLGDSLLANAFHGPLTPQGTAIPVQGNLTGTLDASGSPLNTTFTSFVSPTCSGFYGTLTRQ